MTPNPARLENLEPPKLGCLPIRTTLIVISVIGLLGSPSALFAKSDPSLIGSLIAITLNGCVLYGSLKYHDLTLMIGLKLLYFILIVNFILFCTIPVIAACVGTSGYYSQIMSSESPQKNKEKSLKNLWSEELMNWEKHEHKVEVVQGTAPNVNLGLILGFAAEISIAISSAVIFIEIVMIKRFRQHAVAWREGKAYEQIP
ncbi:unnamed protein product [Caenorhabditis brenneri]